jgi:hypothetical protein
VSHRLSRSEKEKGMHQTQHDESSEEMQTDEDATLYPEEEMETVHLYWYAEQPKRPLSHQAKEIIIACLELALLLCGIVALCLIPNTPAWTVTAITVPAHFIPRQWTVTVAIVPTGIQHYPATRARGTLIVYNGSAFTQQLPARFLVTTANGLEIETDQVVLIAPANPPALGTAIVSAHALTAGTQGNIPVGAINQTSGNALYLKNLTAFVGGQDASMKQYVTTDDQAKALETARQQLRARQPLGLLAKPCTETVSQHDLILSVLWACQYVTYQAPKDGQILSVQVSGNSVILRMRVVEHPAITHAAS